MQDISKILANHQFFQACSSQEIKILAECGIHKNFAKDELIAQENNPAKVFYLLITGHVAICTSIPNRDKQIIQTIGANEIFGWSWLFPPHLWTFDAVALDNTDCIVMDGDCVRENLEKHPELGYKLMKQFSLLIIKRLNATRLQLLDVYGNKS